MDRGFTTRDVDFGRSDVPNMDILYLQESEGGGDVIAELLLGGRRHGLLPLFQWK